MKVETLKFLIMTLVILAEFAPLKTYADGVKPVEKNCITLDTVNCRKCPPLY